MLSKGRKREWSTLFICEGAPFTCNTEEVAHLKHARQFRNAQKSCRIPAIPTALTEALNCTATSK